MERLPMEKVTGKKARQQEQGTGSRRGQLSLVICHLSFVFCLAGCVSTGSFVHLGGQKSCAEPCQVLAAWNPGVVYTPDPVHGGTPNPGLAGRIYMFGPEIGYPMLGDGSLVVELFDDTKTVDLKATTPLEKWRFDRETLKQLQRRDAIGWGYTVFLPWATYKPEITHVHLKVCYEPPKGFPIYAASAPLTLADPEHMNKSETSLARGVRKGDSNQKEATGETTAAAQAVATAAAQQPRR